MSVLLFSKKQVCKIYKGLASNKDVLDIVMDSKHYEDRNQDGCGFKESVEDYLGRMIWYLYVGNVTAYNLQYRENQQISFEDFDIKEDIDFKSSLKTLSMLVYNVYTNDGNYFLAKEWIDTADTILNSTKHRINLNDVRRIEY